MIPIRRSTLALALFAIALQARADDAKAPNYPDRTSVMVVRDASGAERPVKTIADWEVRRGHVLANLQEVMGELPGPERLAPLDVKVLETHKEDGFTRHKIDFQSEPGDRVPAWLAIPDGAPGTKRPAMLCLHQTVAIGKDEPMGLGGKPTLWYARELAGRGYVTIAPDYPTFGEYNPDIFGLGHAGGSIKAVWNNKRAVDLLCALPEVDPDRIGVIGHSLGGHNAIYTAVFEPRLKAVVSSCGFTAIPFTNQPSFEGLAQDRYMPRSRDRYHLDRKQIPFDFTELIAALAPRAFFTSSPLHDDNFDVAGVRVCIAAAAPVYALYKAETELQAAHPDAGHVFVDETRMKAYEFLDERLKPGR